MPPGFRVVFKDGDRHNFDASNLELTTRDEISAVAFARFLTYPAPLQDAIRVQRKLEREIENARLGRDPPRAARKGRRPSQLLDLIGRGDRI